MSEMRVVYCWGVTGCFMRESWASEPRTAEAARMTVRSASALMSACGRSSSAWASS